ncbi:orotate phosphoribosyltransferase [Deinococcus cavernae]|uniref:Orotate phosphoribosyltransferase n=1 Tax=Deinococcus cavernae TaxID=2320857 RepID=A0A418V4S7_9DEIO|nr:orotate phosphoribosyltransferase [Deinococcus cavernae]RJF71126.1 orotate phosphoribosyltransferase [Deinococcus cavernae]
MNRSELAHAIRDAALLSGSFTLRSGLVSDSYFDKYRFESDPRILRAVAESLAPHVPADTEYLAGLEMGGIPVVTMLSAVTGLPAVFVRKEAKAYGTCQLAEGADIAGKRLTIVEDVVTSGGAVIAAVHALRERGAVVEHVLCVIDREQGGKAALEALNLQVTALYLKTDLG